MKLIGVSQYDLYGWNSTYMFCTDAAILRSGFPNVIVGHIRRNLPVNLNNKPVL